jgi:hypothetical protein
MGHPWTLTNDEKQLIEASFKPCPFGGTFAFDNPPLCPGCHQDISVLVPEKIYYLVTGRRVDGDVEDAWT